jgi:hypothetical protein
MMLDRILMQLEINLLEKGTKAILFIEIVQLNF